MCLKLLATLECQSEYHKIQIASNCVYGEDQLYSL